MDVREKGAGYFQIGKRRAERERVNGTEEVELYKSRTREGRIPSVKLTLRSGDVSCCCLLLALDPRFEDVVPTSDNTDEQPREECNILPPFRHAGRDDDGRLRRGRSPSLPQVRAHAAIRQRQEQQRRRRRRRRRRRGRGRDKDDSGGVEAGPGGHLQRKHLSRRRCGDSPHDDDNSRPAATAASDELRYDGVLTQVHLSLSEGNRDGKSS